jgi:hypothetical protein
MISGGGMSIVIINDSANTLNVYPAAGAKINQLANNIAYTLTANTTAQFFGIANPAISGSWYSIKSA